METAFLSFICAEPLAATTKIRTSDATNVFISPPLWPLLRARVCLQDVRVGRSQTFCFSVTGRTTQHPAHPIEIIPEDLKKALFCYPTAAGWKIVVWVS